MSGDANGQSGDLLYHPDADRAHHEPDEVLRRIAPAFPYIIIDKASGDRLVQEEYERLVDLATPDVILQSHKSLFGRTVFVTLAEDETGECRMKFLLQPCCAIRIEYHPGPHRDQAPPMLVKLAKLLGYKIGIDSPRE
jgi:hypothetical protein